MPENPSKRLSNKGGRPKNLPGTGKCKRITIRLTEDEDNMLRQYADSFSNSKNNLALYIHSKLFDNGFQQLSGEQLVSSIKSITEAIAANNEQMARCATQIEIGIKNKNIPASYLDELKVYLAHHAKETLKLQKLLAKALRAATINKKNR